MLDRLAHILGCPQDHSPLQLRGDALVCRDNHRFEFEQGIPIFAQSPRRELIPGNMGPCEYSGDGSSVDPFVNDWIVNTNGNLYRPLRGRLPRYPIPEWPLPPGNGKTLVDIGCSWGRWSIAAVRAGYRPVGVDVHVDALAAATRVAMQLGAEADFVCGAADRLPFQSWSVDTIFSYSVLQHLERSVVLRFFAEVRRILKPGGVCLVQLPNRFGVLSLLQQLRRGFREAKAGTFEMRYWSRSQISDALRSAGLTTPKIDADGFFSQNPQPADLDFLPAKARWIVSLSGKGRRASSVFPILTHFADSLWIRAQVDD
ncbi:MAG TPA: methyltransferase domain-containing protein [Dongiaceae bacterium]|nr:methyltransferase domain-containing protein [Dongiaceae bacterium]